MFADGGFDKSGCVFPSLPIRLCVLAHFLHDAVEFELQQRLAHRFKFRIGGVLDPRAAAGGVPSVGCGERGVGGTMPRRWRSGKDRNVPDLHRLHVHAFVHALESKEARSHASRASAKSAPASSRIGENIRLDPVNLHHLYSSDELLSFFMGKNTPERQEFIIENLRVEKDLVEV